MALGAVSLAGCAKFRTARECGVFVSAIKTWQGQGAKPAGSVSSPASSGPLDSRALAERYEDLGRRIDALNLESAELSPRARRYQKLAREAAAALRDVAAAMERGDAESARKRRVEFDDLSRSEAPLVADINAVCR
ncbi:MAG: hypothetical protein EOO73_17750 [Myxococcales bacterium]|nr:MAG: hypothetical protein EOO73_17750 [Myxococcales bacterium]